MAGSDERGLLARERRLERKEERLRAKKCMERERKLLERENALYLGTPRLFLNGDPHHTHTHPHHLLQDGTTHQQQPPPPTAFTPHPWDTDEERARMWEHERCSRVASEQERVRMEQERARLWEHARGGVRDCGNEVMLDRAFPPRMNSSAYPGHERVSASYRGMEGGGGYLGPQSHGISIMPPPSSSFGFGLNGGGHPQELPPHVHAHAFGVSHFTSTPVDCHSMRLRPARLEHEDLIKLPAIGGGRGESGESIPAENVDSKGDVESKNEEESSHSQTVNNPQKQQPRGVSGFLSTLTRKLQNLTQKAGEGEGKEEKKDDNAEGGAEDDEEEEEAHNNEVFQGEENVKTSKTSKTRTLFPHGFEGKLPSLLEDKSTITMRKQQQQKRQQHSLLFASDEHQIPSASASTQANGGSSREDTGADDLEEESSTEDLMNSEEGEVEIAFNVDGEDEVTRTSLPFTDRPRLSCVSFHSMEEYKSSPEKNENENEISHDEEEDTEEEDTVIMTPTVRKWRIPRSPFYGKRRKMSASRTRVGGVRRRLMNETPVLSRKGRESELTEDISWIEEESSCCPLQSPSALSAEGEKEQQHGVDKEAQTIRTSEGKEEEEDGEKDKEESAPLGPLPSMQTPPRVTALGPSPSPWHNVFYSPSPYPPSTPIVGCHPTHPFYYGPYVSPCPTTPSHASRPVLKGTVVSAPPPPPPPSPQRVAAGSTASIPCTDDISLTNDDGATLLPLPQLSGLKKIISTTRLTDDQVMPTMDRKTIHIHALFHTLSRSLESLTEAWEGHRDKEKGLEYINNYVKLLLKEGTKKSSSSSSSAAYSGDLMEDSCEKLRRKKKKLEEEKAYLMSMEQKRGAGNGCSQSEWLPFAAGRQGRQSKEEEVKKSANYKSTARRVYEMESYALSSLHAPVSAGKREMDIKDKEERHMIFVKDAALVA